MNTFPFLCWMVALYVTAGLITPVAAQAASYPYIVPFQPDIPNGGRAVAVDVHPTKTAQAIVASDSGGLFRTFNRGTNWSHVQVLPIHHMQDVKFAPNPPDGQQVIIATGQSPNGAVAPSGAAGWGGIWRSTDGGTVWLNPLISGPSGSFFRVAEGYGIAFEPGTQNVYVGTDRGLAISQDNGATWTNVVPNPGSPLVRAVVAHSGGIVDICGDVGHQRSLDGGVHFGPVTTGSRGCRSVHALAVSPSESGVIFLATDVNIPAPPGCALASAIFEGDYSAGGSVIVWTQVIPTTCRGPARNAWVATGLSRDGDPDHFDIYFGSGLHLYRQTVARRGGTGPRCSSIAWTDVAVDHDDQNGMAFDPVQHCAQFVVSDGGVHHPTDESDAALCGGSWALTGGGQNGFNALQIYQVTGQIVPARRIRVFGIPITFDHGHTDLYFGTQDNSFWASGNDGATWPARSGCEGLYIQVPRYAFSSAGPDRTVAWLDIGGGSCAGNWWSLPQFASTRAWDNPPVPNYGPPIVITPSVYVQFGVYQFEDAPPDNLLFLTRNTGATWGTLGDWRDFVALFPRAPYAGVFQVSIVGDDVTLFYAVDKGGPIRLEKMQGIKKDGRIVGPRRSIFPADVNGFDSMDWRAVFAVDPNDPSHLLAADKGAGQMKYSVDGGMNWAEDSELTDLVTQHGEIPFTNQYQTQVNAISFDPVYRNHILVGTEDAGIFRSTDGGASWSAIPYSTRAGGISSFFFIETNSEEPNDTVIVSTWGRGLWKLIIPPASRAGLGAALKDKASPSVSNGPFLLPDAQQAPLAAWVGDAFTGENKPDLVLNWDVYPHLRWLAVPGGTIRDISLDGFSRVLGVAIDAGQIVVSSADGRVVSMDLPVIRTNAVGTFEGCPACTNVAQNQGSIRGLVLEDGTLRAIIAGAGPLPGEAAIAAFAAVITQPPPPPEETGPVGPHLKVFGSRGGQATAIVGDIVTLYGAGFCAGSGCSLVEVKVGEMTVAQGVPVGSNGNFQVSFPAPSLPDLGSFGARVRPSEVRAFQTATNNQTIEARAMLLVSTGGDAEEEEDSEPLELESAGTLDGRSIGACFNQAVTRESAENVANYSVNGGAPPVLSATLREDGKSVRLLLGSQLIGSSFSLLATNILSLASNLGSGTVVGVVPGYTLTAVDLGQPMPTGAVFSCESSSLEIMAGGAGAWGTADRGTFVSHPLTGDFDVWSRVIPVNGPYGAIGGLAARESASDPSARSVELLLMPNPSAPPNYLEVSAFLRAAPGTNSQNFGTADPADVPPAPLFRLRRLGQVFTAFVSEDGLAWKVVGRFDTSSDPFSGTLFVGFGAAAARVNQTATMAFRDFRLEQPAVPCLELFCPTNTTVPCQMPEGAFVTFGLFPTNHCNPTDLVVACDHPSGSLFPIGMTTVHCLAIGSGETNQCSFTVTVLSNCVPMGVPLPSGSVAWWQAESNVLDAVGGHHGSPLQGGASYAAGKVGQAFSFDGADGSYLSVPDSPAWDFGFNDFTIEFWTMLNQIKNSMFIHQQNGDGTGGFEFDYQPNGVGLAFAPSQFELVARQWSASPNTWYHLAVTRQGGTYRLYTNGVQFGVEQAGSFPVEDVTGPLRIGSYTTQGGFGVNGLIDELSIYQRALSAAELQAIYNAGGAGKVPPNDPAGPGLLITPLGNCQVRICFRDAGTNYVLQSATNLSASAQWQNVLDPIITEGGERCVIITNSCLSGRRFFRLMRTSLPVLAVMGPAVTPLQFSALVQSLSLPPEAYDTNGFVRFADADKFQAVPSQILGVATNQNEENLPLTETRLLLDQFNLMQVLPDAVATQRTTNAFWQAGLLSIVTCSAIAAPEIVHSRFQAISTNGAVETDVSIDTKARYQFAMGGIPIIGPGAKAAIHFDATGAVTRINYTMRPLRAAAEAPLVPQATADQMAAQAYQGLLQQKQGQFTLKSTLVYYAPPPEIGNVQTLLPHYQYQATFMPTGWTKPLVLRSVLIPAVASSNLVPSARMSVSAQNGLISAQAQVTGGRAPYTYAWNSSSIALAGTNSPSLSYLAAPRSQETVTLLVTDANGISASVSSNLAVGIPFASATGLGAWEPAGGIETDVGVEWIGLTTDPVLDGASANAAGFVSRMRAGSGVTVRFNWGERNAWERDFKDPAFGGNDSSWVDGVDAVFYTGHANDDGWVFSSAQDDDFIDYRQTRFGDMDLEWLFIAACGPLQEGAPPTAWWQQWGPAFRGLHLLCGYGNDSRDVSDEGSKLANYLLAGRTVAQSWMLTGMEAQWDVGLFVSVMAVHDARAVCNMNDHFWGKGSVGPDILVPAGFVLYESPVD